MKEDIKSLEDLTNIYKAEYKIYLITSKYELFVNTFIDSFKKFEKVNVVELEKYDIIDALNRIRFKPLLYNRTVLLVRINNKAKKFISELISRIGLFGYGKVILTISDFKIKSELLKSKVFLVSNKICFIDFDRFNKSFLSDIILNYVFLRDKKFEAASLAQFIVNKIGNDVDKLIYYLESLVELSDGEVITRKDIVKYIPDNYQYKERVLYESLIDGKKTIPFKIIKDLLDEGKEPFNIFKGIEKFFINIYKAKLLLLKGYFLDGEALHIRKEKLERAGLIKQVTNKFLLTHDYKLNWYLRSARQLTLREIIYILTIIKKEHVSLKTGLIDEESLYKIVLLIKSRKEESGNNGKKDSSNIKGKRRYKRRLSNVN